jgi:Predicted membrane protein (DUF2207)
LPRYFTIGAAMTETGYVLAGIGVLLAGWYAVVLLISLATRPRDLRSGPPTPDLGAEPPAVVNLLVTRCQLTVEAADATLLDLAARRILEVFQPGDDPAGLLVRVRVARPDGLTRYERRVFDRVSEVAGDRFTPLAEVTRQYADGGPRWYRHLRAEVVEDATARGLVRVRRLGSPVILLCLLTGMAVVCLGIVPLVPTAAHPDAAQNAIGDGLIAGWFLGSPVVALCLIFIALPHLNGVRYTPTGQEAGQRWLGVAGWLAAHEHLADLPPAAVAVWDRYLAYGVALGVNPIASGAVDLRVGRVLRVRSRYTGTTRTVSVRYPWDPMAYTQAGVRLVWSLGVLLCWAAFWLFAARRIGAWPAAASWPLYALGVLAPVRAGYKVVRSTLARTAPVTVTGQVLAAHPYRLHAGSAPRWYQVVVDDGEHDRTRPWLVRADRVQGARAGDVVRIRAQRWNRYVLGLDVLYRRESPPAGSRQTLAGCRSDKLPGPGSAPPGLEPA